MSLRSHFERRAGELADRATLQVTESDGAVFVFLRPRSTKAVGVVLYLLNDQAGTVALDEQASTPAELGDDAETDHSAIDQFIDLAVTGRATAFRLGRGGCVEERMANGMVSRTWKNAWPWPGWRRRATRFDDAPYV